ncbi:putative bifunctional diguanylate cyclase/phosphodiesterase [Roseateles sp. DB2]|uniref:putative bifunctional diguanylate cyclase/phosphodiesterase n=1 Tax=Roseateles sp. DB2 TaxID=3453717 RepID=UPI003EF015E7
MTVRNARPARHASSPITQSLAVAAGVWVLLYLLIRLSQRFHLPVDHAWPHAGLVSLFLIGLLRGRWITLPMMGLSGLAVLQLHANTAMAALSQIGNALLAAAAAHAFLRRQNFKQSLDESRDHELSLVACLGIAAPLAGLLPWMPGMEGFEQLWTAWKSDPGDASLALLFRWAASSTAMTLTLPLVLSLYPRPGSPREPASTGAIAAALALTLCLASSWLLHWPPLPALWLVLLTLLAWQAPPWISSLAALAVATSLGLHHEAGGRPDGAVHGEEAALEMACELLAAAMLPMIVQLMRARQRQQLQQWQSLFDASGLGLMVWRASEQLPRLSLRWQALSGSRGGKDLEQWLEHAHPLDRPRLAQAQECLLQSEAGDARSASLELRVRPAGDWRWLHWQAQVMERDTYGHPSLLVASLRDITSLKVAREREQLSAHLFQTVHEGILMSDPQHRIVDMNPSSCAILGHDRESLIGTPCQLVDPEVLQHNGIQPDTLTDALSQEGRWEGPLRLRNALGQTKVLQVRLNLLHDDDGLLRYHVFALQDRTQEEWQQSLLLRQNQFDALTGLPNQTSFVAQLGQALELARREGFMLCVCNLDLDHFSALNERQGRTAGDQTLVEMARRLRSSLRRTERWTDQMARIGGDGFGLVLRCRSEEEAKLALGRLLDVVRAPLYDIAPGSPLHLTASLGATLFPQDASDTETLMRHAAHALYRVKRSGRDGFELFDTDKRQRSEAKVLALGRMQEALDLGELQLHFQPKVDLRRGKVLGMEALLRWHDPERGLLLPGHFLPLVEHTGLGVRIGDWVIEQALKQAEQWAADGRPLRVAVNVTARHLQSPDFAQRLDELLARHRPGLARLLMLEVLESAALADVAATQRLIQHCRGLGVQFALDDFGTGYSNLSYLKQLPVDLLKIDRSFVQQMLSDAHDRALVEGVIGLARTFGCDVIAEGVESSAHAQALLALGCEQGQGHGIASAMPAELVPLWVQAFERSPDYDGRIGVPTPLGEFAGASQG